MGYSGRLTLLTILEKKVFRTSAVSEHQNIIFELDGDFSEKNGVTVLQNFLVPVMFFSSKLL